MKHLLILLIGAIFYTTGCRSYDIPQTNKTHPANPQAKSSLTIKRIEALEIDENARPEVPSEMEKQEMKQM